MKIKAEVELKLRVVAEDEKGIQIESEHTIETDTPIVSFTEEQFSVATFQSIPMFVAGHIGFDPETNNVVLFDPEDKTKILRLFPIVNMDFDSGELKDKDVKTCLTLEEWENQDKDKGVSLDFS